LVHGFKVSVYHGGVGVIEQRISQHACQEAEKENAGRGQDKILPPRTYPSDLTSSKYDALPFHRLAIMLSYCESLKG
jgi:hypothetical protein